MLLGYTSNYSYYDFFSLVKDTDKFNNNIQSYEQ